MASLPPLIINLSALITLILLAASALAQNNVLLTGETLSPDHSQLSFGGVIFVMQNDCNLVLYSWDTFFQSNTHARGKNCTLTLDENGRLVIKRTDGSTVWMSEDTKSPTGMYAAVLRPDRVVAIYGPQVWSAPATHAERKLTVVPNPAIFPSVENVLFSGQVLPGNGGLTAGSYNFDLSDSGNLALSQGGYGTIWQTGTGGKGKYCFLRLDHQGRLTILDDAYSTVYATSPYSTQGEYVLIVQENGEAAIYGPVAWSTASSNGGGVEDIGDHQITMATVEES